MEDMVALLLLIEIYYLSLIWCIVPEISKWFQKEGYFYFAREKSEQRQIGLNTGVSQGLNPFLMASNFVYSIIQLLFPTSSQNTASESQEQ